MSRHLREIARHTIAIVEAGRYRNRIGEDVAINDALRAAVAGIRRPQPNCCS